jgi:hypothetical protein
MVRIDGHFGVVEKNSQPRTTLVHVGQRLRQRVARQTRLKAARSSLGARKTLDLPTFDQPTPEPFSRILTGLDRSLMGQGFSATDHLPVTRVPRSGRTVKLHGEIPRTRTANAAGAARHRPDSHRAHRGDRHPFPRGTAIGRCAKRRRNGVHWTRHGSLVEPEQRAGARLGATGIKPQTLACRSAMPVPTRHVLVYSAMGRRYMRTTFRLAVLVLNESREQRVPRQTGRSTKKVLTGSFGSACACRARDLSAGKLTSNLSHRIADVRGRQWTTRC